MSVRFNINDEVLIVVTEHGRSVFDKYHQNLGIQPDKYFAMAKQWDGRLKLPMWQVMHIFGPAMYMGGPIAIDMEIEFC